MVSTLPVCGDRAGRTPAGLDGERAVGAGWCGHELGEFAGAVVSGQCGNDMNVDGRVDEPGGAERGREFGGQIVRVDAAGGDQIDGDAVVGLTDLVVEHVGVPGEGGVDDERVDGDVVVVEDGGSSAV